MATDAEILAVFRFCNDAYEGGHFETIAEKLRGQLPDEADTIVAWLSATYPASAQLGQARAEFAERAGATLPTLIGTDRAAKILSRLG